MQFEARLRQLHHVGDAGGKSPGRAGQLLVDQIGQAVRGLAQVFRGIKDDEATLELQNATFSREATKRDCRLDPTLDVSALKRVIVAPLWLQDADGAPVTILAEM